MHYNAQKEQHLGRGGGSEEEEEEEKEEEGEGRVLKRKYQSSMCFLGSIHTLRTLRLLLC